MTAALDRSSYIGGADVAAILGISPWLSPFMLYQKKIGEFKEVVTPAKQKIFDRGHRWEQIVVEMLVDELTERGHEVKILAQNQRYKDPEHSFLAAEIDLELLIDGEEVNGEAKTVSPFAAKAWGAEDSDDIPLYYAAQVAHGLMIKPRRRAVVAALTGFDDKPRVHWIDRDDETIAAIRAKEVEFWARVQDRRPPEPSTLADVMFLYKRDGGTVMTASETLAETCARLRHCKSAAIALNTEIEVLATKVKLAMGGNATLVNSSGSPLCTWKNNKAGSKTNWQAIAEAMQAPAELIKQHTAATIGNRVFLVK